MNSLPCRWSISCCRHRDEQVRSLDLEGLALAIEGPHDDPGCPLHVAEHLGNREATLLAANRPFSLDDLGVDQRDRMPLRLVPPDVDHRHALAAADLRRGQSDPVCGIHGLEHVVDQATDLVGDSADDGGLLTEDRRAEDVDSEHAH